MFRIPKLIYEYFQLSRVPRYLLNKMPGNPPELDLNDT